MTLYCAKTGVDSMTDETIAELHFGCGHAEMLCFDARREWQNLIAHHDIAKRMEILQTRVWAMRQLMKNGEDKTAEMVALVKELQGVEKELFDLATNWLNDKED